MKVIFLPNNTASLMSTTVPRLRERGIKAYGFNFAPQVFQDKDGIYNFHGNFFHKTFFFFGFIYHLITADIVHWIYGSSSRQAQYILILVGLLKRKKFVEFCGTDVRNLEHLCEDVSFYSFDSFSEQMKFELGTERNSNQTQLKFKKLGFIALPNSPELNLYMNPFIYPEFYPVNRSVDLQKISHVHSNVTNKIPLVVHMPSNPEVKGSQYVIDAAKILEAEGLIQFKLITNTPHEEALRILSNADIVIDQLLIGEYGVLSIEAMAMGKPVICFIRPELETAYENDYVGFPIFNANIKNIQQRLRQLVAEFPLRKDLGKKGKIFVYRYHNSNKNTERLLKIYKEEIKPFENLNNDKFKKNEHKFSMNQFKEGLLLFSKIASTNIFVQIISFLFYPIIARRFNPEEFGVFAFFSSLTVTLSIIVTGQLHNAVVNPESDEEAKQLVSIATWMSLFFGILILALVFIFNLYSVIEVEWFLFPFYLIGFSLFEVWRMYFVRLKNYSVFNFSQIVNRIGSNLFKITKPLPSLSGWLILSEILCYFIASIYLFMKGSYFILPLNKLKLSIVKKYKYFPLFQAPSLLIQLLISEYPSFYFKSIGDLDSLGYYSMGNRLFIQPIIILGNSLNPILVHKFKASSHISKEIKQLLLFLGFASVLIFVLFFSLKETFVVFFLGTKWLPGLNIYELQLMLIFSKLFIGTMLAFIITRNKSHLLLSVRGVELILLILMVNFLHYPFLKTYIVLELISDLVLINMVFWTKLPSID